MASGPLMGKTVLVTRGKEQAKTFSEKLRQAGATPIEIPLISISPSSKPETIAECVRHLANYDWLIFTSANGVKFFFPFVKKETPLPKVAVVGKKTAAALKAYGVSPAVVPDEFVAEGVIEALKPLVKPRDRILLVKGNLARPVLRDALINMGADVTDLIAYETSMNESGKEQLLYLLRKRKLDVITFTSSSTVQSFMRMMEGEDIASLLSGCVIACIGPVTKETAEKAGLSVHICPDQYTIDDMIKEMEQYFAKRTMEGKINGDITI
ncbi:uroporphyrinogen-III synthase [Parageobacillus sp. VR-IP]|uniref:uroporphyrinogen-III synthase n=1 Tax=Parageobacillus sp. VR-IP TaxID=2742205 RepID=UPI0015836926|nr:uroporphyrinogen-III synthase [Parageobacillus sp. VR-IP]NUK30758.1 uroporphyrinogen-III synthase [Parageobacillus sp. VR-IP]